MMCDGSATAPRGICDIFQSANCLRFHQCGAGVNEALSERYLVFSSGAPPERRVDGSINAESSRPCVKKQIRLGTPLLFRNSSTDVPERLRVNGGEDVSATCIVGVKNGAMPCRRVVPV